LVWDSKNKLRTDYNLYCLSNNVFLCNLRDSIDYRVIELNQQVSIVVTKPKQATKPSQLIIVPHGGPNSVYSVDYALYPNVLAMLGYTVASSNVQLVSFG
jgi:hypothetical protein